MTASAIGYCPRCGRMVSLRSSRYQRHSITPGGVDNCPMTNQYELIDGLTDRDHEKRAKVIADLANQVQDEDPAIVWEVLTSMPADELQRLLVFALAAIPTDQTVDQMFAWVRQLPVARAHEAVSA